MNDRQTNTQVYHRPVTLEEFTPQIPIVEWKEYSLAPNRGGNDRIRPQPQNTEKHGSIFLSVAVSE